MSRYRHLLQFGGMTFISRVLGLVRDMALSHTFGASGALDAFFVAIKLPNFLRRLFAEGSFTQAFVPLLSDYQAKQPQKIRRFISHAMGLQLLVTIIICILGMTFSSTLIDVFAPGFHGEGERYTQAVILLRITCPYLVWISLSALCAAVLNVHDRFVATGIAPMILNAALIAATWYGGALFHWPTMTLAVAFLLAGVGQAIFLSWCAYRTGWFSWPTLWGDWQGVKRLWNWMLPTLLGASISQINLLVDTLFASWLPVGGVSWLYYADRLMQLPLGILGVGLSTTLLPKFSRAEAEADQKSLQSHFIWGVMMVLWWGVPAAVGLYGLSTGILSALFGYGALTMQDVEHSALALRAFAFGLPAFMLVKVLTSALLAKSARAALVRVGVMAMAVNVLLNMLLITPLAQGGIALATSLAAWLQVGLLWGHAHRLKIWDKALLPWKTVLGFLWGAGLLGVGLSFLQPWVALTGPPLFRAGHLLWIMLITATPYVLWSMLAKRWWKEC